MLKLGIGKSGFSNPALILAQMAEFRYREMKFMSGDKVFVDTNILVYAYDISAGIRHETAKKLLAGLWNSGLGVISTQVLQEFYVTVTRKLPKAIDPQIAKEIATDLLEWEVVTIEGPMILYAIELNQKHSFSFWDSLIIAAAEKAGCSCMLSEDLSSGRTIGKIKIKNPFGSADGC
jgi:predicted nucleic acid-binding protein